MERSKPRGCQHPEHLLKEAQAKRGCDVLKSDVRMEEVKATLNLRQRRLKPYIREVEACRIRSRHGTHTVRDIYADDTRGPSSDRQREAADAASEIENPIGTEASSGQFGEARIETRNVLLPRPEELGLSRGLKGTPTIIGIDKNGKVRMLSAKPLPTSRIRQRGRFRGLRPGRGQVVFHTRWRWGVNVGCLTEACLSWTPGSTPVMVAINDK